jgi:cyclic pyranopterin phosphate synthase
MEGVPHVESPEILSYEELFTIARVATLKGISKIRITGGEPLVRKDLVKFIEMISPLSNITDLSLTTNGTLLKEFAQPLYNAGIKRVNISLDSLKEDRYREITRGGILKRVWEGIDAVEKTGISPIKINVVVIKGLNDDELIDFARLSLEHPYQIRFIEYMPVGISNGWEKEKYVSYEEMLRKIETFLPLVPAKRPGDGGPAKLYHFWEGKGEVGFISPLSQHFCSTCNRLRLTADGKLRTCLFSDEEIDLKSVLRKGGGEQELKDLFDLAIHHKPERHNLTDPVFKKCTRHMVAIGG